MISQRVPSHGGDGRRRAGAAAGLPNNLPYQVTSFVGRERELVEVNRLVGFSPLLTLTGAGGAGKTRLALRVAAELAHPSLRSGQAPSAGSGRAFADGVWLVELAALADPALVAQAVAAALGIPEDRRHPRIETLSDALTSRSLLLVLDNCEHLVGACAALAERLVRTCPNLRILATSREPLGVPGEVVWCVPSLAVPDPGVAVGTDGIASCEAVALFVDRARAALPTFALGDRNAAAVAEVCRRLDGIPLALELAVARVRVLSIEQIAARLDQRFRLLTGGNRTALPRQQTLRAALDWSYDLLSEPERTLLHRLSVFAGGWTLEAAEAIGGDAGTRGRGEGNRPRVPASQVLGLLCQLVDKSLVLAEEQDGGTMRYRLLETVGQYAAEKLQGAGEAAAARARHCDWYLGLAEAAEPRLCTAEHQEWLALLEAERANLRAALAWSQELGARGQEPVEALGRKGTPTPDPWPLAPETWLRLVGALWWFWHLRGYADEALAQLERSLSLGRTATPAVRAKLLNGAGLLVCDRGDYPRAVALLEEALDLCRAIGDERGIAFALGSLGFVRHNQDDYAGAEACLEESLAVARRTGDTLNVARSLNSLGLVARAVGDHERAMTLYQEALTLWRALRCKQGIAQSLCFLGWATRGRGDSARGKVLLEESLALSRESGYTRGSAWSLTYLGRIALEQGAPGRAATLYAEGLELHRRLGNTRGIAVSLEGLAGSTLAQGRPGPAARLIGAAAALREAIEAPPQPADAAPYASLLASARAALGEERFATLWAEGQARSMDQAIAYALESAGPGPAPAGGSEPSPPDTPTTRLTPREREIAALVSRGLTNPQIAAELVITSGTASLHVSNILRKLEFSSRAQVAAWAVQHGLAAAPPA